MWRSEAPRRDEWRPSRRKEESAHLPSPLVTSLQRRRRPSKPSGSFFVRILAAPPIGCAAPWPVGQRIPATSVPALCTALALGAGGRLTCPDVLEAHKPSQRPQSRLRTLGLQRAETHPGQAQLPRPEMTCPATSPGPLPFAASPARSGTWLARRLSLSLCLSAGVARCYRSLPDVRALIACI